MKNNKLLYLLVILLLIWNIILTVTIANNYKSDVPTNNVIENNVNGFSTDLTAVTKKVKSSTVSIHTNENNLSGFVYERNDNSIYIVTCYHGIAEQSSIDVTFDSGLTLSAKEIGHDIYSDIAVLEIANTINVNKVVLGDNTLLKDAEFLISVGTPNSIEYANSSELCIVSSPLRTIANSIISSETKYEYYIELIQISGNIVSGYSGAPLFNMNGEMVGMISSSVDNSVFALTVNELSIIANKIINGEDATKLHLGMSGKYINNLENYEKNNNNLPLSVIDGYYVTNIKPASIMSNIGLKSGDIISSINATEINNQHNLLEIEYSNVDELTIEIIRDGEQLTLVGSIEHD